MAKFLLCVCVCVCALSHFSSLTPANLLKRSCSFLLVLLVYISLCIIIQTKIMTHALFLFVCLLLLFFVCVFLLSVWEQFLLSHIHAQMFSLIEFSLSFYIK